MGSWLPWTCPEFMCTHWQQELWARILGPCRSNSSLLHESNRKKQNYGNGAQITHDVTQLFTKELEAKYFTEQNTISYWYLHKASQQSIHHVLSPGKILFRKKKKKRRKIQKHNSSFNEFPLVRHLLDQLHATLPSSNFAPTVQNLGSAAPLCQGPEVSLGRPLPQSQSCAHTSEKNMATWHSRTPSALFVLFRRERWKVSGQGEVE